MTNSKFSKLFDSLLTEIFAEESNEKTMELVIEEIMQYSAQEKDHQ